MSAARQEAMISARSVPVIKPGPKGHGSFGLVRTKRLTFPSWGPKDTGRLRNRRSHRWGTIEMRTKETMKKNETTSSTSRMKKALVAIAICGALTGGATAAGIAAVSAKGYSQSTTIEQESPWASSYGYGTQTTRTAGGFTGWGVSWQ